MRLECRSIGYSSCICKCLRMLLSLYCRWYAINRIEICSIHFVSIIGCIKHSFSSTDTSITNQYSSIQFKLNYVLWTLIGLAVTFLLKCRNVVELIQSIDAVLPKKKRLVRNFEEYYLREVAVGCSYVCYLVLWFVECFCHSLQYKMPIQIQKNNKKRHRNFYVDSLTYNHSILAHIENQANHKTFEIFAFLLHF